MHKETEERMHYYLLFLVLLLLLLVVHGTLFHFHGLKNYNLEAGIWSSKYEGSKIEKVFAGILHKSVIGLTTHADVGMLSFRLLYHYHYRYQ
jgi:hypothetical protein